MPKDNTKPNIEYRVIQEWIDNGSRILDLGCGDGSLLLRLKTGKKARTLGVEIDRAKIRDAVRNGISVIDYDINNSLASFRDKSFDYVILSRTLQEIRRPDLLLKEILRIGKKAIIIFPNFGNISVRYHFFFSGKMPKTKDFPYSWYDTPNIHFFTYLDFSEFCRENRINVLKKYFSKGRSLHSSLLFPNLRAENCLVLLDQDEDYMI